MPLISSVGALVGQVDPAGVGEGAAEVRATGSSSCSGLAVRLALGQVAERVLEGRRVVVVGAPDEHPGHVEQPARGCAARTATASGCERLSPVLITRSGSSAGQPRHPALPGLCAAASGAGRRCAAPGSGRAPAGSTGTSTRRSRKALHLVQTPRTPARRPRGLRPRARTLRATEETPDQGQADMTQKATRAAACQTGPHVRLEPRPSKAAAPRRPDHRDQGAGQGPLRHHPDGAVGDQRGRGGRCRGHRAVRPAGARRGDPRGQEAARGRGGVRRRRPDRAGRARSAPSPRCWPTTCRNR